MSPNTLRPIGDILKSIIKEKKWQDRFRVQAVWDYWDEVVGEFACRETQPRSFKQGCLFVDVSDPMWMHHLQFSSEVIRENLNKKLGAELVKNIRFTLNPAAHKEPPLPQNNPDPHCK